MSFWIGFAEGLVVALGGALGAVSAAIGAIRSARALGAARSLGLRLQACMWLFLQVALLVTSALFAVLGLAELFPGEG